MNRKKILLYNVSFSVVYKSISLIIVFVTLPLVLKFLDTERYGIWVTIFSIINMIFVVDFGVGNGLRTRLAGVLSTNNRSLAKKEITNTYFFLSLLSVTLFIIGYLVIHHIDIQNLLNTNISNSVLTEVFVITLTLICLSYVLSIYKPMFYALQQAANIELSLMLYNLGIIALVIIAIHFFPSSIKIVAVIYGGMHILVGMLFTTLFFWRNPDLIPRIRSIDIPYLRKLLTLSSTFFVIQFCMVVIFTTDNIIISNLIGPEEVTIYDIVNKLFSPIITILVIAQGPLWSMFTESYQIRDLDWIRKTLQTLNKLFIPIIFIILAFVYFSRDIIRIWIGQDMDITFSLVSLMGVFVAIRVYGTIYMSFLNGIGAIRTQMWFYVLGAVINIPLSIYFVKILNMGSSGVILGTIASLSLLTIALPIQTFRILNSDEIT